MAHAEAYKDPGTPDEQSRRTFMANAVIALGGVMQGDMSDLVADRGGQFLQRVLNRA